MVVPSIRRRPFEVATSPASACGTTSFTSLISFFIAEPLPVCN